MTVHPEYKEASSCRPSGRSSSPWSVLVRTAPGTAGRLRARAARSAYENRRPLRIHRPTPADKTAWAGFKSPPRAGASPPGSCPRGGGHRRRALPSGRGESRRREVRALSFLPAVPPACHKQRYPADSHGHSNEAVGLGAPPLTWGGGAGRNCVACKRSAPASEARCLLSSAADRWRPAAAGGSGRPGRRRTLVHSTGGRTVRSPG
jgi:hypothetical protein